MCVLPTSVKCICEVLVRVAFAVAEKQIGRRMLLPSDFDRPKDSWDEVLERECSETVYQRIRYASCAPITRIWADAYADVDLEIAVGYSGFGLCSSIYRRYKAGRDKGNKSASIASRACLALVM